MIVTVANQKGGVGKTDLSVNLASSLAEKGKTLLIDLDPQANSSSYLGVDSPDKSTGHLLMDSKMAIGDIARKTSVPNLFIAPACKKLNVAQAELMSDAGMQFRLKRKLKNEKGYDFVIIDTPPSLGALTVNALSASDQVLVPVQVHYFALEGVDKLMESVDLIRKEINPKLNVRGFVLTMHDKRNKVSNQIERQVRSKFGDKVFRSKIPVNIDLVNASKAKKPIKIHAPNSRGTHAYRRLAKEFMG
jgi:chromosome partitioning protein